MPQPTRGLLGFAAASLSWLPAGIVVLSLLPGFGLPPEADSWLLLAVTAPCGLSGVLPGEDAEPRGGKIDRGLEPHRERHRLRQPRLRLPAAPRQPVGGDAPEYLRRPRSAFRLHARPGARPSVPDRAAGGVLRRTAPAVGGGGESWGSA